MAFIPLTRGSAGVPPFEKIPCSLATSVGTALTAAGALATGTAAPAYVAVEERSAGAGYVNAVRVTDDLVFETELSEASASIAVGTKYTISADGGKITATATSGVAEVVSFDGKAAGDTVRVRF